MDYLNNFLISDIPALKNISDFLSSLTIIDVIFFFSIILLMILVVILLYFIKVNEDVVEINHDNSDFRNDFENNINNDNNINSEDTFISEDKYFDEGELIDLTSISKALENLDNSNVDLTAFEEEQEKEAVISYDELINKAKSGSINYKTETMYDDLSVKEVDLDNLISKTSLNEEKALSDSHAISYAQEEEFLEALKKLQKQLN